MPKKYAKRTRGNFDPTSTEPFRISRSKVELFVDCPRCFYLDQRDGVARPSFPAFTLNSAVDELLKREFDAHRAEGTAHPLMKAYGLDAVPFRDERMDEWRDALRRGVQRLFEPSNLLVRGGVDDIWHSATGDLIVVDYKATSKKEAPTIDGYWQQGYKRQVEIYQWLLRGTGAKVSDTAYFVYVNGRSDKEAFDGKLEFDVELIAYQGTTEWIEPTLIKIGHVLRSDVPPEPSDHCEYCLYREAAGKELRARISPRSPVQSASSTQTLGI